MRIIILLLLLALCSVPQRAEAHAHVFLNYSVEVQSDDTGITALQFIWKFDAMFSTMIINDFGIKGNGQLDEKETAIVKAKAFDNTREFHYFLNMELDGKPWQPDTIEDFAAKREPLNLLYRFVVKLPQPVKKLSFSSFDPEYYVDVWQAKVKPVTVTAPNVNCDVTDKVAGETVWGLLRTQQVTCTMKGL
jgi:ABC-type uncharacterized transport system substrate-binding protein